MTPTSTSSETSQPPSASEAAVIRRPGRHRIYINVGYVLTEEQLRSYFGKFGSVLDVYLPKHKSGRNKGFGFTTFDTEEELERVLRTQEHVINGSVVKINRAGPRPEYGPGLPPEKDAAKVMMSDSPAVTVESQTSKQLQEQPPQQLPPQQPPHPPSPTVQPPVQHGRGPRLYVGGIHNDITEDDVKEHFSRWGRVLDVYFPARVDAGKKGARRVNYCFVTFENWRSAQQACNESERSINGLALQSISVAEDRTKVEQQRAEALAAAAAAGSHGLADVAALHKAMQQPMMPPSPPALPPFNLGAQGPPVGYSPNNLLQYLQQAQANPGLVSSNYGVQQHTGFAPAPPPAANNNTSTLNLLSQTPLGQMVLQQILGGNVGEQHAAVPPPPAVPADATLRNLSALLNAPAYNNPNPSVLPTAGASPNPFAQVVQWGVPAPPTAPTTPQLSDLAGLLDPATLSQLASHFSLPSSAQSSPRTPQGYGGYGLAPQMPPRRDSSTSLIPPGIPPTLLAHHLAQMGADAEQGLDTSRLGTANYLPDTRAHQGSEGWGGLDYASLFGVPDQAGGQRVSPAFSPPRERYAGALSHISSMPTTPSLTPVTTPVRAAKPLFPMFSRDGMSTGPSSPRDVGSGGGWAEGTGDQRNDALSSSDILDSGAGIASRYGPQRNRNEGRGGQGRGYSPY